jgi:hypothetical protein
VSDSEAAAAAAPPSTASGIDSELRCAQRAEYYMSVIKDSESESDSDSESDRRRLGLTQAPRL